MLKLRGVDISVWQGQPDFNQVKQNTDFVIIKSSEGNGFTDPQFKRNQTEIRKAGLLLGYYHFARPDLGNTPQAEADWFLKVIGTIKEGELLVLDYEVNFANPVSWCKDFLSAVYNKTGCRPLIYLNQSQILGLNWQTVINENYGLWVASYDGQSEGLSFNTPWATVAMKQYTSSGSIPGISGNVDMNSFFGDINTYKAYGYHAVVTPPQPPISTGIPQYLQTLLQENNLDINNESQIREFFQKAKDYDGMKLDLDNTKKEYDLAIQNVDKLEIDLTACNTALLTAQKPPETPGTSCCGVLDQVKIIVWDKWTWTPWGVNSWKNRLSQLRELIK